MKVEKKVGMMKMRTPATDKPDFTLISDIKLKEYADTLQEMIYSYKYFAPEKIKVLEEIWKEVNCEYADRLKNSAIKELSIDEEKPAEKPEEKSTKKSAGKQGKKSAEKQEEKPDEKPVKTSVKPLFRNIKRIKK